MKRAGGNAPNKEGHHERDEMPRGVAGGGSVRRDRAGRRQPTGGAPGDTRLASLPAIDGVTLYGRVLGPQEIRTVAAQTGGRE